MHAYVYVCVSLLLLPSFFPLLLVPLLLNPSSLPAIHSFPPHLLNSFNTSYIHSFTPKSLKTPYLPIP